VSIIIRRRSIPATLLLLALLIAVLLYLLPPEETLGNTLKAVFIHGALVEAGLLAFGAAGLLGLACLVRESETVHQWCLAAQKTTVILWIVYAISSMIATYLAWGVAIAWNEPRVRVSANLLGAALVFLLLVLWVRNRYLTGVANIVMAALAWGLTKGAVNIRHPLNPIGTSDSVAFKWFFAGILIAVILMTVQTARWFYRGEGESDCEGEALDAEVGG
jgi:hypothetical protein